MPTKSPLKPLKVKVLRPDFKREKHGIIAGADEAGRGPLAGPVTAACVFIPLENRKKRIWTKVRDSKVLTRDERENLFGQIQEHSCYGIASCTVEEIDDINILHASMLAIKRATEQMCATFSICPDLVLIDGNYKPQFPYPVQTVVKGDMLSVSIAAASILAKVTRDRYMCDLHEDFPHYNWQSNVGYSTPDHLNALKEHGPCDHHRRGFTRIKELLAA